MTKVNVSSRKQAKETAAEPSPRAPLNRDRILRAALELADREGIDALSMRKLAQALGVEAMSLYNHVANKDEILAGMVDAVFTEVDLPDGGDWKTAMRQRYLSTRDTFARHPWALGLLHAQTYLGDATLRHHDEVLGRLRRAGFSIESAGYACSILDSYTYGFALREQRLPFDSSKQPDDGRANLAMQLASQAYPYLAEMAMAMAQNPGHTHTREFTFGLDLILGALERLLPST